MRTVEPKTDARVAVLAERLGLSESRVRAAVSYYGEYPEEIDAWIAANDAEAVSLEAALERERELLG